LIKGYRISFLKPKFYYQEDTMLTDKLKSFIQKKEGEPNKKKVENLVVFLIILIITIIVINAIWSGEGKESEKDQPTSDKNKKLASEVQSIQTNNKEVTEDTTVKNLEEILSKINGVGKVKVMITYSQTSKNVPLYNQDSSEKNTEESDKQGGTRKITETDTKTEIIYKEENGEKVPITQSIISPTIEGAIITAEGAGNATVKTNIIQAVEAVTGVATHKIQVFEMSKD